MPKLEPAAAASVEASRLGQLDVLRDALSGLVQQKTGIEAEIEQRMRRREELLALPLPRDDVMVLISEAIAQRRSVFSHGVGEQLDFLRKTYLTELPAHTSLLPVSGRELNANMLEYVLGASLQRCLEVELRSWDWPSEVGPPRAERAREIARLDGEIESLEAELTRLLQAAREAGVRL